MQIRKGVKLLYAKDRIPPLKLGVIIRVVSVPEVLHVWFEDTQTSSILYINKLGDELFLSTKDFYVKPKYSITRRVYGSEVYYEVQIDYRQKNIELLSQVKSIQDITKSRCIDTLYHFTNASNLKSIFANHLIPVANLRRMPINFEYNDTARLDFFPEGNSMTISFPNDYYFRKVREGKDDQIFAILEYDANFLRFIPDKLYFCKYNAARSDLNPRLCNNLESFNDMFCEKYYRNNPNSPDNIYKDISEKIRESDLPLNFTTHSQAEILIESTINTLYIKRVIFQFNEHKDMFASICQEAGKKAVVDERYFKLRHEVYKELYYGK